MLPINGLTFTSLWTFGEGRFIKWVPVSSRLPSRLRTRPAKIQGVSFRHTHLKCTEFFTPYSMTPHYIRLSIRNALHSRFNISKLLDPSMDHQMTGGEKLTFTVGRIPTFISKFKCPANR